MSSRKTNALITISGRKGYVVRALRGSNEAGTIVATDADPMAPVRSADATFAHVPRVDAGDAYVSALLSIAARERIDCVVPVNDIDVCVLAQASDRFSQAGATVFVPPPEVTEILCDKLRAAQWLRDGGLETPETFDVETALRASGLSAPLIAKPRRGQGSRGQRVIDDIAELGFVDQDCVVQPIIEGKHLNLDVVCDGGGNVVAVVAKHKLESVDGTASLVESVERPELIALAERIAALTNHVGGD